jgi:predicted ATPase with chaperone activity
MVVRRRTTLLPTLTLPEVIDTTHMHRVSGDRTALVTARPFRVPHHTISDVGLIGGATCLKETRASDRHSIALVCRLICDAFQVDSRHTGNTHFETTRIGLLAP